MYFLENSTSNFNFHTEEEMPENNKRNTKMVTGEEIGSGGGEFTLQSKPQESSRYFIHIGVEKMEDKKRGKNSHRNHREYENLPYDNSCVTSNPNVENAYGDGFYIYGKKTWINGGN